MMEGISKIQETNQTYYLKIYQYEFKHIMLQQKYLENLFSK